ncbi:MAG: AI-2E family transporter [Anaerolineaceae bacterium]
MSNNNPTTPKVLEEPPPSKVPDSPPWSRTTKLIVGLILASIVLLLVIKFQDYISLILTSFLLAFLFQPIAKLLVKHLKLSWRFSVVIVYIVMVIVLLGLLAWGGISLFGQLQNLIDLLDNKIGDLTTTLQNWSGQDLIIGPFSFTIPEITTNYLSDLLVERVQPILGEAGNLIGDVFSGGANLIFRALIMYLVSFFVASESGGNSNKIFNLKLPGYQEDLNRMEKEIFYIWNAFIRGEFIVVGTAMAVYCILLAILGMPYFIGLAMIAGLGRFIPYVGAWVSWITFGLVALFAQPTPLGLTPVAYMALVVGCSLVLDSLLDNVLQPKVMGNALKVHPAAVLLSALVGSQLLGLIGVILAAPVYATAKLIVHYVLQKLTDQDPWEGIAYYQPPKTPIWIRWIQVIWKKVSCWVKKTWKVSAARIKKNIPAKKSDNNTKTSKPVQKK